MSSTHAEEEKDLILIHESHVNLQNVKRHEDTRCFEIEGQCTKCFFKFIGLVKTENKMLFKKGQNWNIKFELLASDGKLVENQQFKHKHHNDSEYVCSGTILSYDHQLCTFQAGDLNLMIQIDPSLKCASALKNVSDLHQSWLSHCCILAFYRV